MLLMGLTVLGILWLAAIVVVAGLCGSAARGDRALAIGSSPDDDALTPPRLRLIA